MNKKIKQMIICMACGLMVMPLGIQAANEMSSEQDAKMVIAQKKDTQNSELSNQDIQKRLSKKAEKSAKQDDKVKYHLMNKILNSDDEVLIDADLDLANLEVNELLPEDYGNVKGDFLVESKKESGKFIKYTAKQGSFAVYSDNTAGELKNTVAHVRIDKEDNQFTTVRKIKVGDQRGAIILEYGAPNAIWQSPTEGQMIYWYEVPMNKGKKGYLAFTVENMKVKAIDTFAQNIENIGIWPKFDFHHYESDKLEDSDFSLLGYRLGEKYIPAKGVQREWNKQGLFNYHNYTASRDGVVIYDEDYRISTVILTLGNSVTRRGVGVGSNVVLALKVYGVPTRIVEDFAFKSEEGQVVYEYENPFVNGEYLIFVVNGKDDFIDTVILTNRSTKEINIYQNKEEAKNLVYGRIASVRNAK